MFDKILKLLALIQGPQRFRAIVAILIFALALVVAWEAESGMLIDHYINYRANTIKALREKLAASQQPNPRMDSLDREVNRLLDHRASLQHNTVGERLWRMLRPFIGGAAFWVLLGIICSAASTRLGVTEKDMAAAQSIMQLFAWFGVLCGIAGIIFNNNHGLWFTFMWFPILAGMSCLGIALVIGILIGPPAKPAPVLAPDHREIATK